MEKDKEQYSVTEHTSNLHSWTVWNPYGLELRTPEHAIFFVRQGTLVVSSDDIVIEVHAPGMVFVKRDCFVKFSKLPSDTDAPFKGVVLIFDRKSLKDFYKELRKNPFCPLDTSKLKNFAVTLPETVGWKSLVASLDYLVKEGGVIPPQIQKLKLIEATYYLLSSKMGFFSTLFDFSPEWKIDLHDFMETHFTQDLTLEEFARYSGRSIATFKRDFAIFSKLTPQKWLIERRLDRAHELLNMGLEHPTTVGQKVGFRNRSHFSTAYKKKFGYPPSQTPIAQK